MWAVRIASPVFAHELAVAVVVSDASDARDGFQLAVDESPDVSHPPGEDGGDHLGGIDVHVTYVLAADQPALTSALERGTRVVAIVAGTEAAAVVRAAPGSEGAFVVVAAGGRIAGNRDWVVLTDAPGATRQFDAFESRFRAAHGRNPSVDAARAYDAAKVLDQAIGSLGESIGGDTVRAFDARAAGQLIASVVVAPESEPGSAAGRSTGRGQRGAVGGGVVVATAFAGVIITLRRRRKHPAQPR